MKKPRPLNETRWPRLPLDRRADPEARLELPPWFLEQMRWLAEIPDDAPAARRSAGRRGNRPPARARSAS